MSKQQLDVSTSMCLNSLNSGLALEMAEGRRGELSPDILLWKLRKFLPWGPQRCSSNMSSSHSWTFLTGWLQMSLSATLLYPEKNPLQEGSVLSVLQSPGRLSLPGSPADSSAACRSHFPFHLTFIAEGFENREKPEMLK